MIKAGSEGIIYEIDMLVKTVVIFPSSTFE
jgi:hypothetical protein